MNPNHPIGFDQDELRVLSSIREHYGTENQVLKTMEELNELSVELSKFMVERVQPGADHSAPPSNMDHLHEEMADVLICLQKMGDDLLDWTLVQRYVQFKLERQCLRMERDGVHVDPPQHH